MYARESHRMKLQGQIIEALAHRKEQEFEVLVGSGDKLIKVS